MHWTDHLDETQRYRDFRPSQFDPPGLGLDDRQSWYVAPCSQTRDSEPLEQSNFASLLVALGGESDTVEVHRFGHWGPGWFEIVIVDPNDATACQTMVECACSLADYPVLDESDYSERESDAAQESWQWLGMRDRMSICVDAGLSAFSARREYWPDDDTGSIRDRLLGY